VNATANQHTQREQFRVLKERLQAALRHTAETAEKRGYMVIEEELQRERHPNTDDVVDFKQQYLSDLLRQKAAHLDAPFQIAVVGEFNRGKSTLINALLGKEILANRDRPNTAAKTVIRSESPSRFVVRYRDGRPPVRVITDDLITEMAPYVSDADGLDPDESSSVDGSDTNRVDKRYEDLLTNNARSLAEVIEQVEVWYPSKFLSECNIEIIDTPGLGSVFPQHKLVTYEAIRTVDATLFVIQIDPGVGSSEVAFVRTITEHIDSMFFVLTKIDKVRSATREQIDERRDYWRDVLEHKAKIKVQHIFPISAKKLLDGQEDESRFDEFVPALESFLIYANGLPRLFAPLQFARIYTKRFLKSIEDSLSDEGNDLSSLKAKLVELVALKDMVKDQQAQLTETVRKRLYNLSSEQMLSGIELLPSKLQMAVESELNGLSQGELREVDRFIDPAMKDVINRYLDSKKKDFTNEIRQLNQIVREELLIMLKSVEFNEGELSLIRSINFDLSNPINTRDVAHDISDKIVEMLAKSGVTDSIAQLAGSLVRTAQNTVRKVGNFLSRLFGGSQSSSTPVSSTDEIRRKIKVVLTEKIPGNACNAYYGVVYGYKTGGRTVAGVEATIVKTFNKWADDLVGDIDKVIRNNVDRRIAELEAQIAQSRDDESEWEARINKLKYDQVVLQECLKTFDKLEGELKATAHV